MHVLVHCGKVVLSVNIILNINICNFIKRKKGKKKRKRKKKKKNKKRKIPKPYDRSLKFHMKEYEIKTNYLYFRAAAPKIRPRLNGFPTEKYVEN